MAATSRFAGTLTAWTGGRAVRLATLSGRVPELYVAALGALKAGGVFTPLFSAFGPEPIKQIDGDGSPTPHDTIGFDDFVRDQPTDFQVAPTPEDQLALLHFTRGTTGLPKGVMHVHRAVVAHHATGGLALDLRPGDIYWCTADPGWVTGTSTGASTAAMPASVPIFPWPSVSPWPIDSGTRTP